MIRKLVAFDPNTGNYTEVDVKRLKSDAQKLIDHIHKNIDQKSDEFKIWKLVEPLCQQALDGNLRLPFPYFELPLKYEAREGLLPNDFDRLYAEFKLTVSGAPRELLERLDINGVAYTYANFEG